MCAVSASDGIRKTDRISRTTRLPVQRMERPIHTLFDYGIHPPLLRSITQLHQANTEKQEKCTMIT